jgi:hypothetical protein
VSRDLTRFEREVYELIKRSGEIITTDVPDKLGGAIPNLVNKGQVEVYKRRTSQWNQKERKFLRVREA